MLVRIRSAIIFCGAFICCACAVSTVQKVSVASVRPPHLARIIVARDSSFTGSGCGFWIADDGEVMEVDGSKADRRTFAYATGNAPVLVDGEWSVYLHDAAPIVATDPLALLVSAAVASAVREATKRSLQLVPSPQPELLGSLLMATGADAHEQQIFPAHAFRGIEGMSLVGKESGEQLPAVPYFFELLFEGTEIGSVGTGGELVWDRVPGSLTLAVVSEPPFGRAVTGKSETIWTEPGRTYRFELSPNIWSPEKTLTYVGME